jgi:hypothetical protein
MMNNFGEPNSFLLFLRDTPLFFKIFEGLIFTLVIGGFCFVIIRGISIWLSNNAAEVITHHCKVVDKRTAIWGGSGDSSARTTYYITFEFEDSSRKELQVSTKHFGVIVSGDNGELIYQGTRFKEFRRLKER